MIDLIQRALAVPREFMALGNERFEAEGAAFIRNRDVPVIRDANLVMQVTASTPSEIDRLLARVEQEFADFPHRSFELLDFTTPPIFEACLALDDYQRNEGILMLLQGDLVGTTRPHDIRPVIDDTAWDAYSALYDLDWREYREQKGDENYDEQVAIAMIKSRRAKSPLVRSWLAYVDGEPRAYCSSWAGVEGIGMVEDLFTHPDFRHRGLATALIHHCVADSRAQGAGPVVIGADPKDTPKHMYASMGFRPMVVIRDYWKNTGA